MQGKTFLQIPFFLLGLSLTLGVLCSYAFAQAAFTNKIGMKFVLIPAGSFIMGSPESEKGRQKDEKQHKVIITKSFYMSETEVTQGQWDRLVAPNPSSFKLGNYYPVDTVSWNEAVTFIQFLNKREGTTKYRLPTEAEWEYACRAGSQTAFATGGITTFSCKEPEPALVSYAWYCFNSGGFSPAGDFKPHPVKLLKPNKFGLYDMHGNVQEWVQDACQWRTFWSAGTGTITRTYVDGITDPLETKGEHRVVRGGGWFQNSKYQRCAYRTNYKPVARRNSLGFRIVREQ
ncbi:formylglycine-generating enzyme family protein [Desulfobacter vibrioformis]|uniref:formylglycine-generating enzyme family protein n=1 Tax=Desulfobacter vibrioformis TaxID=34031 RepID=UPI0005581994|nr:formylglycine-generating enzyme family protein [Desulfobacter vibrioformis]